MSRYRLLLAGLLVLGAGALGYEAWHLGMTVDEPSHLAAAYMYWQGADVLRPSDSPPLTRMISGWVPRVLDIPLRRDTPGWQNRDAYQIGTETVAALEPARARRFLFFMRLPFIAFPLLIAWLLFRWGSELFGERIGLVLVACGLLEPTILGHGALIKSDIAAAFGALWFAYAAWRYWLRPDLRRLLWMTLALVAAALIKFTLLPLVAVALVLALWRGPRLAGAALIPLAVYVGTIAAYQFQAAPVPRLLVYSFRAAGVPSWAITAARVAARLPWPEQYIRGLLFILHAHRGPGFASWMLGHKIGPHAPGYYPLAWAIKYPIPLQLLAAAGLAALVWRLRRRKAAAAGIFIWGFAAWYFGWALLSSIHIGFRHVLPALPFFILGGGFALAEWGSGRAGRIATAVGVAWLSASSLCTYPQGVSYFNEWIGGPANGWKYLADSNVDWGQNLPELATLLRQCHIPAVRTFLFGLDPPGRYFEAGTWEPLAYPYSPGMVAGRRFEPSPGFYAVSVNLLVGYLAAPGYEDYVAGFRARKPIGRAGYSIFVYEVR